MDVRGPTEKGKALAELLCFKGFVRMHDDDSKRVAIQSVG